MHGRHNDVKFADVIPSLVTRNATPDGSLQVCRTAPEADRDAVLKRWISVEVHVEVVPHLCAQMFRNKKRRDIGMLMRATIEGHRVKIQKTNLGDHGLTATVSLFE